MLAGDDFDPPRSRWLWSRTWWKPSGGWFFFPSVKKMPGAKREILGRWVGGGFSPRNRNDFVMKFSTPNYSRVNDFFTSIHIKWISSAHLVLCVIGFFDLICKWKCKSISFASFFRFTTPQYVLFTADTLFFFVICLWRLAVAARWFSTESFKIKGPAKLS